MLFNSLVFALFLPIVFGVYWWLGGKKKGLAKQNVLLLLASYVFYGWWDLRFLALIFVSSLTDFLVGRAMGKLASRAQRRPLLFLSLAVNLGMLGFFKYYNFFAKSFADGLHQLGMEVDPWTLKLILPVGISFYTFQTLSYTIDVYRGQLPPSKNFVNFFAFVSFFPQLVAGPIEKARDLIPQFSVPRKFDYGQAVSGLRLILYGILKKVMVADRLGEYVTHLHAHPESYDGWAVIIGAVFFTIQVYCDFSGYSDIALGTARLFGFRLSVNFRTPLFSTSTAELWRRWHISLNAWFRDYVYVPLGGREGGPAIFYRNMFIVFMVSAFWHGANWTYLAWGLICALSYMLEGLIYPPKAGRKGVAGPLGWLWAIGGLCFAFIFFRSSSMEAGLDLVQKLNPWGTEPFALFTTFSSELDLFLTNRQEIYFLATLLVVFFALEARIGKGSLDQVLDAWPRLVRWSFYYTAIALLILFGAYGVPQQFIYFQF
ncbi:UNVERIFIED_CONTAM: hypothetical protein GTU68_057261 [Idotea baltica]|nr:hypothetical protein [Idotea baltica]